MTARTETSCPQARPSQALCPTCGTANECAMADGNAAASCWCMTAETKPLPVPATTTACYCANCLRRIANAENNTHAGTE